MEKIDLVIVGAEGVAESGGIINKVSTLAMLAPAVTVVYVCVCGCWCIYIDRDLPAGCDGKDPRQTVLRGGRELQVCEDVSSQPRRPSKCRKSMFAKPRL